MKKISSFILIGIILLITFSVNSISASASSKELDKGTTQLNSIDLNNLDELEKTGQVTIRELTYEQFLKERSKEYNLSLAETRELYSGSSSNEFVATSTDSSFTTTSTGGCSGTYVMQEINIEQQVKSTYKPAVQIFTCTYKSGTFRAFKYIQQVGLDRNGIKNNYVSRKFDGTVSAKITSESKLWWSINGDFNNNGNMAISGGVGGTTKVIGKEVTANFNMTYQTDRYAYWENDGTYSLY